MNRPPSRSGPLRRDKSSRPASPRQSKASRAGRPGRDNASSRDTVEREGEIDALRARIDALDEQLVRLLNERASCALAIGEAKQALGLSIYQPEREREVLEHVERLNEGPLDAAAVRRLFERIIDEARRLERVGNQENG